MASAGARERSQGRSAHTAGSSLSTTAKLDSFVARPSNRYPEVEEPNRTIILRGTAPPQPTLPKKPKTKTWCSRARERFPLTSSLIGEPSAVAPYLTGPYTWGASSPSGLLYARR